MNVMMPQCQLQNGSRLESIEFWPGMAGEIDRGDIAQSAVPVKGVSYHSPLRFMDVYLNTSAAPHRAGVRGPLKGLHLDWKHIQNAFFPRIPGVTIALGDNVSQPPFAWRETDARYLAISFTYNTNALYRILKLLNERRLIPDSSVEPLLERACLLLAHLYQAHDHFLIRNINNNFNMYLVSKVIEVLVGRKCYDSGCQELESTRTSLEAALALAREDADLPLVEKMGTSLGRGVSFIESRIRDQRLDRPGTLATQDVSYQFHGRQLAIDHRQQLLDRIADAGHRRNTFELAVVLDDATETVTDLLWLQDLAERFPFFKAHLLVNTAQVSINFSSHMLSQVCRCPSLRSLFSRLGQQLLITRIYCPFISFQTNYLPAAARQVIDRADAVFVKGANFFETCQIPEKDVFHAFVVYGPISRSYTGLNDFDGVFAFVPAGTAGYLPPSDHQPVSTLLNQVRNSPANRSHVCPSASDLGSR